MSDLWTRERVERELSDHVAYLPSRVTAALLAIAECQGCSGMGRLVITPAPPMETAKCPCCGGTGYTQWALARGMAALQGEGT